MNHQPCHFSFHAAKPFIYSLSTVDRNLSTLMLQILLKRIINICFHTHINSTIK